MSRPRKPTKQLEASGAFEKNPKRRRINEPVATGTVVRPKYLKGKAKAIWDEQSPIAIAMGTLTVAGVKGFASWCDMQAQYEENPRGMDSARIKAKQSYEDRFGMNAAATARLATVAGAQVSGVVRGEPAKTNEADKYFSDAVN